MSFYVGRNYTVWILLSTGLLAWGTYYLANKTNEEKNQKQANLLEQEEKRREIARQNEADRIRRKAAYQAKLKAEADEKQARLEAKANAEADARQREAEKLAAVAAQKEREAKEQAKREFAWKQFKGTKYAELVVAGKTYKDVTVLSANAHGIVVSYEHGGRKFKYQDLSEEIQKLCLFDQAHSDRIALAESERKQKMRIQYKESLASRSKTSSQQLQALKSQDQPQKPTRSKEEPKTSRGTITCRVTRQYRKYEPSLRKEVHFKDLEVRAVANVPATLYINGKPRGSVQALSRQKFNVTSGPYGKYTIELKDKSGKLLDSEKHNRKSGL
ncbi:hypothetical protein [Rubritalea tangerina]|uniref:PEGA domain-containing protein n=1 Tax=Rubritalea tangerina TaxID=430798 RepID=A0ABW4ZBV9_9BACT